VALAFQAPPECARSVDPAMAVIARGNPLLASLPSDRGVVHSAPRLLNKLRRGVQETLARIEYAYDYGMPQWAARIDSALRSLHLERLLLGFQKFCHFRIWYRDQLRDFVLDVLRDSRTRARSYYNRAAVDALAQRHSKGAGNFTLDLHRILTLEMIERRLMV
jgi:asparagine synthase (glutamine-hydrolysing)